MDKGSAPPPYGGDQPAAPAVQAYYQAQPMYGGGPLPPSADYPPSQPAGYNSHITAGVPDGEWTSGLCDCCADCKNCCVTCCCPCITFGQNVEILDRGNTSCGTAATLHSILYIITSGHGTCCYTCGYRKKLRYMYNLPASPCNDCCVHCFCPLFALCQEHRELKNRGWKMSIGYHSNVEAHAMTRPPHVEGMTKKGY